MIRIRSWTNFLALWLCDLWLLVTFSLRPWCHSLTLLSTALWSSSALRATESMGLLGACLVFSRRESLNGQLRLFVFYLRFFFWFSFCPSDTTSSKTKLFIVWGRCPPLVSLRFCRRLNICLMPGQRWFFCHGSKVREAWMALIIYVLLETSSEWCQLRAGATLLMLLHIYILPSSGCRKCFLIPYFSMPERA